MLISKYMGAASVLAMAPHDVLAASTADPLTPKGQGQAMRMNLEMWGEAERKELAAHVRNHSWNLVDRAEVPYGTNITRPVWVYKIKRDEKFKARLCVDGSSQLYGENFDQTHASALRIVSLRCLASIQSREALRSARIDLVSAYLQGDLEDGTDGRPRISARSCNQFTECAKAGAGFRGSFFHGCNSMLVAREGEDLLIVAIYVDDAFCLYREEGPGSLYDRFYADFHAAWETEDDGELHDMLNIQYEYGEGTLKLHQQRYIEKLSAEFFPDGVPDLRIGQTTYSNELPQLVLNAVGFSAPTVSPESHKRY